MDTPDRRSQSRLKTTFRIRVQGVDSAGDEFDDAGVALEVSRRGLSFQSRRRLRTRSMLTVLIPGRGARPGQGATDFFAKATVIRCFKQDGKPYTIGVRFVGATLHLYNRENR